MSWNYSGNPNTSTRDFVRFIIGDTNPNDPQFQNEEILYVLGQNNQLPYTSSVIMVERLIAKYARRVDKRVGDLSISYGQLVKQFQSLLQDLRNRSTLEVATPYAGGMTFSDKQVDRNDADRVQPNFRIGQMDRISPVSDVPVNNDEFGSNQ